MTMLWAGYGPRLRSWRVHGKDGGLSVFYVIYDYYVAREIQCGSTWYEYDSTTVRHSTDQELPLGRKLLGGFARSLDVCPSLSLGRNSRLRVRAPRETFHISAGLFLVVLQQQKQNCSLLCFLLLQITVPNRYKNHVLQKCIFATLQN
jgi:hypothetical protein